MKAVFRKVVSTFILIAGIAMLAGSKAYAEPSYVFLYGGFSNEGAAATAFSRALSSIAKPSDLKAYTVLSKNRDGELSVKQLSENEEKAGNIVKAVGVLVNEHPNLRGGPVPQIVAVPYLTGTEVGLSSSYVTEIKRTFIVGTSAVVVIGIEPTISELRKALQDPVRNVNFSQAVNSAPDLTPPPR